MEFLKNIFDWTMSILGWLLSSLWDIIVWLFTNWEVTLGGIIALVVLSFVVGIISSIGSTLKARAERKAELAEQAEKQRLFYMCKSCGKDDAREKIGSECLNVEYLGSECELEDEDGIEQTVEETETLTKKEEQQGTTRRHRIKMQNFYQCKYCDEKTEEIQNNTVSGNFWCCPECAKDYGIEEIETTELGTFKSYKEVTETNSRGEKTKQVSITKVREKTDYKCSNCGHQFSCVNSRELR